MLLRLPSIFFIQSVGASIGTKTKPVQFQFHSYGTYVCYNAHILSYLWNYDSTYAKMGRQKSLFDFCSSAKCYRTVAYWTVKSLVFPKLSSFDWNRTVLFWCGGCLLEYILAARNDAVGQNLIPRSRRSCK